MMTKITRKKRIENKLKKLFNPINLEVRDDSKLHAGHMHIDKDATETHFYIKITSKCFENVKKIEMHKIVYLALEDEFKSGLHALELSISSE